MYDLKISGGLVVDGSGAPGQIMDIGIVGDRIVAVGSLPEAAAEEIDATGRVVTPGFVDIHTHYDGQATWDQEMAPSSWHGVTTVVMGNCGVGFAPAAPDRATSCARASRCSARLSRRRRRNCRSAPSSSR